jgi:hypothetical protein
MFVANPIQHITEYHSSYIEFEFEFILFVQGQCTLINVSVKVLVLPSRLIFNRSPWAGY